MRHSPDGLTDTGDFVDGQVVEDDRITPVPPRDQGIGDVGAEALPVRGSIEQGDGGGIAGTQGGRACGPSSCSRQSCRGRPAGPVESGCPSNPSWRAALTSGRACPAAWAAPSQAPPRSRCVQPRGERRSWRMHVCCIRFGVGWSPISTLARTGFPPPSARRASVEAAKSRGVLETKCSALGCRSGSAPTAEHHRPAALSQKATADHVRACLHDRLFSGGVRCGRRDPQRARGLTH